MRTETPQAIYLRDYAAPHYRIETIDLQFHLSPTATQVRAVMDVRSSEAQHVQPLILQGEELQLRQVLLNERCLREHEDYEVTADSLIIAMPPRHFTLTIETEINPASNTALEGLYLSNKRFCTQCEAHGFRKIMYYLDRPDVMARFTTKIIADKQQYPLLLSNGNLLESGDLLAGQHYALWQDPYPKPAYLFALVAGQLAVLTGSYTTKSGREVALKIFTEPQNKDKCAHALWALQKAMRWDEEVYGLEYDLETYMIVAVNDFNMGAMENKGLNIFNSQYVLADASSATDNDYQGIETVIGHEYFHNWTGNRVTLRDWFQLSLKEGLTVFRDQEFSADMGSRAIKRIDDVNIIRTLQFSEDSGPTAHAVRPQSYIEMNNFYTVTVYNKGAEVIRMLYTLLGKEVFHRGMDLYIARHDGQAVTTDDLIAAMAEASGKDLAQFSRWYDQAGTPQVQIEWQYCADKQELLLEVQQSCAATAPPEQRQPFLIPLAIALLGAKGEKLPLSCEGYPPAHAEQLVLNVSSPQQTFRLQNVPEKPVVSLFRGFSAPVKCKANYHEEELMLLLRHESDAVNQWDAAQQLYHKAFRQIVALLAESTADTLQLPDFPWLQSLQSLLQDKTVDKALLSYLLQLPNETLLADNLPFFDIERISEAKALLRKHLATELYQTLHELYAQLSKQAAYQPVAADIAARSLRNRCLQLLYFAQPAATLELLQQQLLQSNNMTDTMAALQLLAHSEAPQRQQLLDDFYQQWRHDPLVVNKWLRVQALSERSDTLAAVQSLLQHQAFQLHNPNCVYALLVTFAKSNLLHFHTASGEGYQLIAENIALLNAINPQVAARLVSSFFSWRRFDAARQALMCQQLQQLLQLDNLSRDVYELVTKSLN